MTEYLKVEEGRVYLTCPNCDFEGELVKKNNKVIFVAEYKKPEVKKEDEPKTETKTPEENNGKGKEIPTGKKSAWDNFIDWLNE